jgi:hypothetical protein
VASLQREQQPFPIRPSRELDQETVKAIQKIQDVAISMKDAEGGA